MHGTINMCTLNCKIQAFTLVGIMITDECNILHVVPQDDSCKSKHVVQHKFLCRISYAGEQREINYYNKSFLSQS
jgi:hypothetical protein